MKNTAVALRHVAFEDLDALEAPLRDTGFEITYVDTPTALHFTDIALASDLLIVLGGPMGVYQTAQYPFLVSEIDVVRRRLSSQQPVLGICLGAQIMASALGAPVYPGTNGQEIGWGPLRLTDAGRQSALSDLGEAHKVLHWHGDTFDLPVGAALLASTARYAQQAFSYGNFGLALQFHLEASASGLERWYVGHDAQLRDEAIDVPTLRHESLVNAPVANNKLTAVLHDFLSPLAG